MIYCDSILTYILMIYLAQNQSFMESDWLSTCLEQIKSETLLGNAALYTSHLFSFAVAQEADSDVQ